MKVNKKYIYIILAIILVVASVLYIVFKKNRPLVRDYAQIEKSGVLHIVTDYNPVGYYVSGDTISGFNHDLIELLKNYASFDIEVLLETSLDKSIEGLNRGKYDIVVRNIPITSELRNSLSFTESITQNRQVLIQRKKEYNDNVAPIRSHLDLSKKTIYVPHNSPAILRIKNLSHEIGDTIYYAEDNRYEAEQLIYKVAAKEIDFAVCDEKIAKRVAQSLPEIDYATYIGFTQLEAWAVRSTSSDLLDSLNVWIDRFKGTEEYTKIYNKYYK